MNLILDVCLNFIKTTENERQKMLDDPKDFVQLALDTCDKQNSNIVKTQAAKALEAVCDNVDGTITHVIFFCIQALNLTLSKEKGKVPLSLNPEAFANIEQNTQVLEKSSFITNSKPDVIIETGITVIGLLSYVHSKESYKLVFSAIEQVLEYYIEDIIKCESKLILCRYSLFLGYMIDVLFKNHPEAFR